MVTSNREVHKQISLDGTLNKPVMVFSGSGDQILTSKVGTTAGGLMAIEVDNVPYYIALYTGSATI